jgi:hypothetical protein
MTKKYKGLERNAADRKEGDEGYNIYTADKDCWLTF